MFSPACIELLTIKRGKVCAKLTMRTLHVWLAVFYILMVLVALASATDRMTVGRPDEDGENPNEDPEVDKEREADEEEDRKETIAADAEDAGASGPPSAEAFEDEDPAANRQPEKLDLTIDSKPIFFGLSDLSIENVGKTNREKAEFCFKEVSDSLSETLKKLKSGR